MPVVFDPLVRTPMRPSSVSDAPIKRQRALCDAHFHLVLHPSLRRAHAHREPCISFLPLAGHAQGAGRLWLENDGGSARSPTFFGNFEEGVPDADGPSKLAPRSI